MGGDLFSYQQGLSQGNAESIAALGAVNDWKVYGNKLQGKLRNAEFDFAKAEAGRIGFAHLFKSVAEELRRLDPSNPLLRKDVQLKILGAKVAEKAAEMGYMYDLSTGTLIDKR